MAPLAKMVPDLCHKACVPTEFLKVWPCWQKNVLETATISSEYQGIRKESF